MTRRPFRQNDLTRALRGAKAAGARKAHVEIDIDGKMTMDVDLNGGDAPTNGKSEGPETPEQLRRLI
jgi:hypothetical protein